MKDYIEIIKKKIKKIGTKKIIIIIISLTLILLFLATIAKYIDNKVFENKVKNKEYAGIDDFKSVREVVVYMGCNYISEKDSKDKKYIENIYLQFNKDLYEGENSNQQFFENISIYIAKVLKYSNFVMIDKSKNITIEVICDNEKQEVTDMIVNGNSNYFEEQDSKMQVKNYKEDEEIEVAINSNILNNLIKEEWIGTKTNFGSKDSTFKNYDIYFEEGIEVRKIGKRVFNIVFNKKYNTEIVNNIKVGDSFNNIKNNLGNPIFEQEDIIGYKTKDMYIFFNQNEISIYRNDKETSEDFVEFLSTGLNMSSIKVTASNLTDIWSDYDDYQIEDNQISLTYSLKGVKLEYNVSDNKGITLYKNYIGSIIEDKSIKNIGEDEIPGNVNINVEEDLVFVKEKERVAKKGEEGYYCSMQISENEDSTFNISSNKVDYYISQDNNRKVVKFFSKDGQFPKLEIEEEINSFMWIDDYRFLYSVSNKGIYVYNPRMRTKEIIKEGKKDFNFKEYESGILKYDEQTINIK